MPIATIRSAPPRASDDVRAALLQDRRYDNAAEFPASIPTFEHYLRDLGYRTCLSGKMHFAGPDQLHGFEERVTTDIYPSDFGWTPDWLADGHQLPPSGMSMRSVVEAGVSARSL